MSGEAKATVSIRSPRLGTYLYLLLAAPTFAPQRLGRLLHPGLARSTDATSREP